MKKPVFAALLALLYCVSGAAQNTNEWHTPKGLPSGNEIGVRYGAQLFMGDGRGPEFEAISIDYARYNYYNIGFRTGLNLFFDDEVCDYYSIPMQFTWPVILETLFNTYILLLPILNSARKESSNWLSR